MHISAAFIQRPVMTILAMAAFVLAGVYGYSSLPVSELPQVDFPTIDINASLPGADATTMAAAVATPLEKQFSLIAGLDSMTSQNALGQSRITLQFRLDRNIDAAAQDVQSAMSAAARQLPPSMLTPPSMRKVNPAEGSIIFLTVSSPTLPLREVDMYTENLLIGKLSSISGVAQADIFGQARPAVHVYVDPNALAARGIGIDEVASSDPARQRQLADRSGGWQHARRRHSLLWPAQHRCGSGATDHRLSQWRAGAILRRRQSDRRRSEPQAVRRLGQP